MIFQFSNGSKIYYTENKKRHSKDDKTCIKTINSSLQFKLSFLGTYQNLLLLENILYSTKNISLFQFCNYLSQIVYCTESGLKNIIINTKDTEHMHDITALFYNTPKPFQRKFRILSKSADDNIFINYISKTDIMDNRGNMNINKITIEFLDKNCINTDGTINLIKTASLNNFIFLRTLLDEIYKYDEFTGIN